MFPQRILLATDFSPLSRGAERAAAELARATGARLEVFHSVAPFPREARKDPALREAAKKLMKDAADRLQSAAQRLRRFGVSPRACLVAGVPWEALLVRARETKADLIVVGTHGLPKRGPIRLATLSHRLLLVSRVPVLVVPAR
jgi:nucleotide-binding universal stress UspA family protein